MDFESLLDPVGEAQSLTEMSDLEIFQAIMEGVNACENVEIISNDNVEYIPPEPHPTQRDFLEAVSIINSFVADFNDPSAHKIEVALGSFIFRLHNDEAREARSTLLTDYFSRT
ncbi:hypothetical protein BJV74DRAFT_780235 [Russula compacta]|nr:hypothetical protein BJV74DRAFT_780235 [Russula compacta]